MKIIAVEELGKKYKIRHEKEALVRHIFPGLLSIKKYDEFWALRDINFEINEGECLGVIGSNGAGKTTLLNILSGITFPTEGRLNVNGRISTILSLGAGFHSELTGEENIYLNASILGLGIKEIKKRFKQIAGFSELGDFIYAPLMTYSRGMYMRLGFSIAIHIDFDILLIDELLNVGDIAFQQRCLDKLKEFQRENKTMVIISQVPELLKLFCHKILLLENGKAAFLGAAEEGIRKYLNLIEAKTVGRGKE